MKITHDQKEKKNTTVLSTGNRTQDLRVSRRTPYRLSHRGALNCTYYIKIQIRFGHHMRKNHHFWNFFTYLRINKQTFLTYLMN